ncbi:glycosyltransferase family 39 protein [Actinomycetota bacterium Odt1-20B]
MWRDESVTYQVAHRSLPELWDLLGNVDAVHGLYYLFMHGVFRTWDGGLAALRMPSVVATVVAAAGVGVLARHLSRGSVGILAGVAFAVLPLVQQYAQEGRSYALVTAAVVWATWFFVRGVEQNRSRTWMAYAGIFVVACWLHEFAALAMVAHAATLWWCAAPKAVLRRWAWSSVGAAAMIVPLAVVSSQQADRQLGWLGRPSAAAWILWASMGIAACLMALFAHRNDGTRTSLLAKDGTLDVTRLALPLVVLPAGLLMVVSLIKPWYVDRYVLYGMVGLALLMGRSLERVLVGSLQLRWAGDRRVPSSAVAAATALVAGAVLIPWSLDMRSPESRKDDVIEIAEAVRHHIGTTDNVLFMPARRREWLLSSPSVYDHVRDLALERSPENAHSLEGTELSPEEIRQNILASDRIMALTDPRGQPLDSIAQETVKRVTLKRYFQNCGTQTLHGAQLVIYARPGHCGRGSKPPINGALEAGG